jgi:hypothetical protein
VIAKTTADLISEARARTAAPATDGLVSDSELLSLADQEMRSEVAQILIAARSEYWLEESTASITSGTATYRIPDRALGMGMRDVTIYDANDNEWNLIQVPADRRYLYSTPNLSGAPSAFTLENGELTLLPTPSSSDWTLRLRYYVMPPRLVQTSEAARISSAGSTTTLTLIVTTTPPSTVTTVGALVDIVRGGGMFETLYADRVVAGWASPTLTLESTTPIATAQIATSTTQNQRADYLCPSGQTVFPPLPDTLWPVLVAATCRAYCEAIGDARALEIADAMFARKVAAARSMLTPRVDGEEVRIVPLHTPLRGGRRRLGGIFGGVR